MRVGRNPYKGEMGRGKAYIPKRVTVCVLTFIPDISGYYAQRFEVMKVSFESLFNHTSGEFDVLVFDNGSCEPVREYLLSLHNRGLINYLMLSSENLGYNGGLNFIFNAAPGEYIAYADDDVFYHPGWLEACLKIAENYPDVGYVTGCPVRNNIGHFDSSTLNLPNKISDLKVQSFTWPTQWDDIHANSLGADLLQYKKMVEHAVVKQYSFKNIAALTVSTHFQYLFPRQRKDVFLPFKYGTLMSSEPNNEDFNMTFQLDKKLNERGFCKLSTTEFYTEHIGNIVSERCEELIKLYGLNFNLSIKHDRKSKPNTLLYTFYRIMNLPGIKNFFRFINNFSFKVLNWKTIYRRN